MVDRAALEMRSPCKRTGGSNPSLSAINSYDSRNVPDYMRVIQKNCQLDWVHSPTIRDVKRDPPSLSPCSKHAFGHPRGMHCWRILWQLLTHNA